MAYSWLEFKEHNVNYAHFVLLVLLFWFWTEYSIELESGLMQLRGLVMI